MVISHFNKCLFLHPHKTGGSSIRRAFKTSITGTGDYGVPWRHSNARDSRKYIGEHIWERFYKFGIIRNPFIKLVSWYQHPIRHNAKKIVKYEKLIHRDGENEELRKKIKEMDEETLYLRDKSNFEKSVDLWATDEFREKELQKKDGFWIFENMVDWFDDGDGWCLDYLIRLETIEQGWRNLCSILDIPYVRTHNKNIGYIGISHDIYKEYYTPRIIKKVAKLYEKDLDTFKYTFEE